MKWRGGVDQIRTSKLGGSGNCGWMRTRGGRGVRKSAVLCGRHICMVPKLHSSLILHPNDPILVLKWWQGLFLWKSIFEIWPPIFGSGESPISRKIMISKIFLRKIYLLRHFSIFFDGTGLKMTEKRSARNCRSPIWRFLTFKAIGGGSGGKKSCWAHFIELFLPNSLVLVSSKNSKYFSRYSMKRVAKHAIFGPKNDVFWAIFRPKKLYFC